MLENLEIKPRKRNCAVRTLMESLSEADQAILTKNLLDKNVPHYALQQALKGVGVKIADSTITRHRTGECSCSRI
jgi:hypothetical protein